jgi:hypothetical protein
MSSIFKKAVTRALEKDDYSLYPKPYSSNTAWGTIFDRLRDEEGKFVDFV